MAWKNLLQQTLSEALISHYEPLKELDDVLEIISWSQIEVQLSNLNTAESGAKSYPPLMMFKKVILQQVVWLNGLIKLLN